MVERKPIKQGNIETGEWIQAGGAE